MAEIERSVTAFPLPDPPQEPRFHGAAGLGGVDAGVPAVVPTPGCGRDPGQATGMLVRGMIQTMGVKAPDCADTQCGAWSYLRYYWMSLPSDYDNTKAYPLVLEGPTCGAQGNSLYLNPTLSDAAITGSA